MSKLLLIFLSSLCVVAICIGGPGVYWYDRHFQGWSWGVHIPFTKCCSIGIPPGIAVQDARTIASLRASAALDLANVKTVTAALNDQNARVEAISAQGAVALAKSETATSAYRAALAAATKNEATLISLGQPSAAMPDACARAEAVDRTFVESLK